MSMWDTPACGRRDEGKAEETRTSRREQSPFRVIKGQEQRKTTRREPSVFIVFAARIAIAGL
ncbi:hypothetical protein FA95DRAFT_1564665 [Auriscalpium vulgare]|uniref:Uncharacterized protein n=1 Tax=Auriscalpium vulgare TaxID=40419 RepID=A0ACB8RDF3_9AGAM|nr:hypothetical protein FA95DRAFT_1564665 [Auriscalpium vulgare]